MKKIIGITLLFSALGITPIRAADNVSLQVQGEIYAAPCEISSDSIIRTVDLGNGKAIEVSNLRTTNSVTDWVSFDINLERCPVGTTTTMVEFQGTPDSAGPEDLYQNIGSASNIAIQLQGSDGEPYGNGKKVTGIITGNSYSYHLRARVLSKNGDAGPGTISSVVTAVFTYN